MWKVCRVKKNPVPLIYCNITKDDFVFNRGINGDEIGKMPGNSLTVIYVIRKKEKCN